MTDFKILIEQATEKRANEYPQASITTTFKSGASLPNELLLKALEALKRISYNNYRGIGQSMEMRMIADDALSEIRTRLEEQLK